jgi:hypothetical protein
VDDALSAGGVLKRKFVRRTQPTLMFLVLALAIAASQTTRNETALIEVQLPRVLLTAPDDMSAGEIELELFERTNHRMPWC